jgi:hypothetical protein
MRSRAAGFSNRNSSAGPRVVVMIAINYPAELSCLTTCQAYSQRMGYGNEKPNWGPLVGLMLVMLVMPLFALSADIICLVCRKVMGR